MVGFKCLHATWTIKISQIMLHRVVLVWMFRYWQKLPYIIVYQFDIKSKYTRSPNFSDKVL